MTRSTVRNASETNGETHKHDFDAATPETGDEENDTESDAALPLHKAPTELQTLAEDNSSAGAGASGLDPMHLEYNATTNKQNNTTTTTSSNTALNKLEPQSLLQQQQLLPHRHNEPQDHHNDNMNNNNINDMLRKDKEDQDNSSQSIYSTGDGNVIWKARMMCGNLVNNEYVQITVICLIIINALMMGIGTFDAVTQDEDVDDAFQKIDRAFLVIFTVEVAMQLFYLGVALFADGWLFFDLLIVIFSWSFEGLQIVRAFRIFRAFRLITRVKPLRDLVLAIGAVMPRMYAIAALLMLIFYIFSVLFTELFSDLPLSDNYFGSLDRSLFTCMEMMTLEWGEIAREVMLTEEWAWAPFAAFIMITGFIVFNLIVAVVCDAVAVTEKTVRELDGYEPDNPGHKLAEAQERIDLLQCHINDMLRTQENVQNMIEMMAGELLHLEAERMKAENKEVELRLEMKRRSEYEREMQSSQQIQSLERNYILEKERRESERRLKQLRRKASLESEESEALSQSLHSKILPSVEKRKFQRRHSSAGKSGHLSTSSGHGGRSQKGGSLTRDSSKGSLRSFDSDSNS